MDWSLDNLTPRQERGIEEHGYVGAFYRVFLPRLLAMEVPKGEPAPIDTSVTMNTYVPLAFRRASTL